MGNGENYWGKNTEEKIIAHLMNPHYANPSCLISTHSFKPLSWMETEVMLGITSLNLALLITLLDSLLHSLMKHSSTLFVFYSITIRNGYLDEKQDNLCMWHCLHKSYVKKKKWNGTAHKQKYSTKPTNLMPIKIYLI